MCIKCHNAMPKDVARKQLLQSLENPHFELWNLTSLNHMIISLSGHDGYEMSELAGRLLKNYILWAREHLPGQDHDTFEALIDQLSGHIQSCKDEGLTDEQLMEKTQDIFNNP